MEHFFMKADHLIQNGEWEEARKLIKDRMNEHPRLHMINTYLSVLASSISGETSSREKALSELSETEAFYKKFKKSEVGGLIAVVKDLNQQVKDGREDCYHSEERQHTNFVELDELNEEQLTKNFQLDFETLLAEIHFWRGILQFQGGNILKGLYNMRKSYNEYKDVYKEISQHMNEPKTSNNFIHSDVIHNAEFGVGSFNFLLGILPPYLLKILSIVGFDVDRERGIEMLRKILNYGGRNKTYSSFMLCVNFLFIPRALVDREKNLREVGPIIENALNVYPKSTLLKFMSSHYERKLGNVEKAIRDLVEAVETCKTSIGIVPYNYLCDLAINYILLLEWEKATTILDELISSKEEFDTRGVCAMMLSVCKEKFGDKQGALDLANSLEKYVSKHSKIDKFALEKINLLKHIKSDEEKHLVMLISTFQLLYLRRDLANLNSERASKLCTYFDEIVQKVNIDEKSKVAGDIKSGIATVQGQLFKSIGKSAEANQAFETALLQEGKIKYEKQWIASSYYEIGEAIYMDQIKDKELDKQTKHDLLVKVKKYFDKCYKISGYPFEEVLISRVRLAIKQVEQEIQQSK
ncbi:hypothetical protein ABK040_000418 [Willaertia magna]